MLDAGVVDTELNDILLKTHEAVSDSTTHYNKVEQQVKQSYRREKVQVLHYYIIHCFFVNWSIIDGVCCCVYPPYCAVRAVDRR